MLNRRDFLKTVAAGIVLAGVLPWDQFVQAAEHGHGHEAKGVPPEEALKMLQEGNERFVSGKRRGADCDAKRREELTKGQQPFATILCCSDSRVPPEVIFDQGLGRLFIVRVAGNLIDAALLGSIEYAVLHTGSKLVVVLGHESCGAVTATAGAVEKPGAAESPGIEDLVLRLTPAVKKAAAKGLKGKELVEEAAVINARMVSGQICEKSPVIDEMVKKGEVKVVPAKYFLGTGKVQFL
jgi:carbonic anhydrase